PDPPATVARGSPEMRPGPAKVAVANIRAGNARAACRAGTACWRISRSWRFRLVFLVDARVEACTRLTGVTGAGSRVDQRFACGGAESGEQAAGGGMRRHQNVAGQGSDPVQAPVESVGNAGMGCIVAETVAVGGNRTHAVGIDHGSAAVIFAGVPGPGRGACGMARRGVRG